MIRSVGCLSRSRAEDKFSLGDNFWMDESNKNDNA